MADMTAIKRGLTVTTQGLTATTLAIHLDHTRDGRGHRNLPRDHTDNASRVAAWYARHAAIVSEDTNRTSIDRVDSIERHIVTSGDRIERTIRSGGFGAAHHARLAQRDPVRTTCNSRLPHRRAMGRIRLVRLCGFRPAPRARTRRAAWRVVRATTSVTAARRRRPG